MANDRYRTRHNSPWIAWIGIGVLLVSIVGLLTTYAVRPRRSSAEDAQTAAAIRDMDKAQGEANDRREEKRSAAAALL